MKRFCIKILLYFTPIIIPVLVFMFGIYPNLNGSGDLGALGMISFPKNYILPEVTLHQPIEDCIQPKIPADSGVLVIGDSFTNGSYRYKYVDFLADYAATPFTRYLPIQYGSSFNHFVYLSKTCHLPKVVILESVERILCTRAQNIDFNHTSEEMIERKSVDTTHTHGKGKEKGVLELTQEYIKKHFDIDNPVKKGTLKTALFSCEGHENELYYYNEDIIPHSYDDLVRAKEGLDSLFAYAAECGVHVYVLIAADKYSLYQSYLTDEQHYRSIVLDSIGSWYKDNPYFINSKDTLSKMAAAGVQDIYFCNDTHWSQVAAKAVAEQVAQRIMETEGDSTLFRLP